MRWTKDEIEKCIRLLEETGDVKYVSIEINRTVKAICVKMGKIGLTIRSFYPILPDKRCLQCGILLERGSDFRVRKFCSQSCFGTHSGTGRKHSEDTKLKIGKASTGKKHTDETKLKLTGENNSRWKGGVSVTSKTKKIFGKIKCTGCGIYNVDIKHKRICEDCRIKYYKYYRPSCEFDFNLNDYEEHFDLTIIKKHGKYSPKNKGNNLNGVSRDHLYSVKDGFKNNISPSIIKHPANCELITHRENQAKYSRSKITIEELMNRIIEFDLKYKK
jgi:hypothetical protein